MKKIVKIGAIVIISAVNIFAQSKTTLINGAGATFPYPLYSKWFYEYAKIDKTVNFNYQSIGSGGGIRQILAKTVDFGASDAVMDDETLKKATGKILHIPATIGCVAIAYNIPEVAEKEIKLSGEIIADIYLGKIKKWNDKKIIAENPDIPSILFPDKNIVVARRADGSGTTAIFTDYLCSVSKEWQGKVGKGTSVNWPVGLGGKGNEGVTAIVKNTPYSIGYMELSYAIMNKLKTAAVKNKSGNYILPSEESSSAAVASIKNIPEDYRVSIVNPEGENSYPISGFSWLLVYQKQDDKLKGQKIVEFLRWAITDGQKYSKDLHYSPLPKNLQEKILKTINNIEY